MLVLKILSNNIREKKLQDNNFFVNLTIDRLMVWFVYFLLGTMPLVFGAVHPIVSGVYYSLMLVLCGGWLLFSDTSSGGALSGGVFSFWLVVPLFLIGYITFQSIPLPVPMIEFLSPARAERMEMVASLGGGTFVSFPLGDQVGAGFYQALVFIGLIFYYFTLRYLFKDSSDVYMGVLYVIVALGTFEAFYGLLQFVKPGSGTLWLTSYGRGAHGTIIYKNQFASFMNMIWPLVFALGVIFFTNVRSSSGVTSRGSGLRDLLHSYSGMSLQAPLFILLGGFMVLATIFSLSRGGILSCLVTVLLLALLLPLSLRMKATFFALFIGFIFGYGTLLGWDTVLMRFDSVDNSASTRMSIYLSSVEMALDHCMTGIGMGSYELLSDVYVKWLPEGVLADRVHCEYLELLIELGVPAALLLFIWIITGMFIVFRSLWKREKDSPAAIIGIAAWCGLVSFLIHGFIDFGWRLPANLFYAVTLFALATGSEVMDRAQSKLEYSHQKRRRKKSSK